MDKKAMVIYDNKKQGFQERKIQIIENILGTYILSIHYKDKRILKKFGEDDFDIYGTIASQVAKFFMAEKQENEEKMIDNVFADIMKQMKEIG
jgi:hypothetical protein